MKIIWSQKAVEELDDILVYIASHNQSAATVTVRKIAKLGVTLQEFSRFGKYNVETKTCDIRISKTKLMLAYAIQDDCIRIVSIWHTSRDPQTRAKRDI